jgi:hypothetical protein
MDAPRSSVMALWMPKPPPSNSLLQLQNLFNLLLPWHLYAEVSAQETSVF